MFLEPIYLNEVMLMNCASHLFKGVSLNALTVSTTEDAKNFDTQAEGNAEGGIDILSNLLKATGGFSFQGANNSSQSYQNTIERNITLGSLHMDVINTLTDEKLYDINCDLLKEKPTAYSYVKIQAILKPVDFYSVLEILKLILPQLESFFDLAGDFIFKPEKGKNQNQKLVKDKVERAVGTAQALSNLIGEIEKDYQNSNQLEMIMIDSEGNNLGVLDIDIQDRTLGEIKAQLTDGEFVIFGKIVRYIDENSQLNLVQRSLLSSLTDKLNRAMELISVYQNQNPNFLNEWKSMTKLMQNILNELITLKMQGPVIRVKAMSVCM